MILYKEENYRSLKSTPKTINFPEREKIDAKYKWRLTDIYISDDDWEKCFQQLKERMTDLDIFHTQLMKSAKTLLKCLRIRDELAVILGKLSFYAHLKADEDTRINKYQSLRERVSGLAVQFHQKISFIQPELIAAPEEKIWQYLDEEDELLIYKHYMKDILRTKCHILDEQSENLLALSSEIASVPYNIFSMFDNADIKFPKIINEDGNRVEITKGNFSVFMRSRNRDVRKNVYNEFYSTYGNWINTLASGLSGAVKKDIFFAKSRRYNNSLEAALDENNIPVTIYSNLINSLTENLQPLHHYFSLRKKIMGIENVRPWDIYVPLINSKKWEVSYQEAVEIIQSALTPLGKDYLNVLQKGLNSGWIDVHETRGKRSGAYSSAVYGSPHPYILLNYNNLLDDLFTLAHEMGHSIHSYYTIRKQPFIYSNYTIFVAEVASTLNETLLLDYLLKNTTDKQKRIYLLNQFIDQIRGTVYSQTIFAEFENIIHETAESGGALTAEYFNQLTREIYTRYYGPAFEIDKLYEMNWCRIPHFYYNFYVYQYATGFSAATSLAQKILSGDHKARDAYLEFLSRGSSAYSIDLLKDAGINMTSPEPIVAVTKLFNNLVGELEKLLHPEPI